MSASAPASDASFAAATASRIATAVHEGVERDVDLTAADMAVSHRLHEFLICEIFRAAAGVERAHTHVYGVRSVLHGGDNALRRAGGGQKFYHCSYLLHYNTE